MYKIELFVIFQFELTLSYNSIATEDI